MLKYNKVNVCVCIEGERMNITNLLQCAKSYAKHFPYIILFIPHNNSMRDGYISISQIKTIKTKTLKFQEAYDHIGNEW